MASRSDKQTLRERNAAKPFAEKLRVLEKLRERDRAIRSAKLAPRKESGPRKG